MSYKLELQDGSVFEGVSFGADTSVSGELVFTTGMVGYPESLTDPSYRGQILVLTYPLIGNYGVPKEGFESNEIHIKGLIVQDYTEEYSHWEAVQSLGAWLRAHNVPALYGIDTRVLTQKLTKGAQLAKIVSKDEIGFDDPNTRNLVEEVSIKEPRRYGQGQTTICVVDCGMKTNILRSLLEREVTVLRVPCDYDFTKESYDGLLISNGPGDPAMCTKTIEHIRAALQDDKPILGICLGNQLLALAAGAKTYKMSYGHRGQNQPCIVKGTKRCYITSQNHGFAVDAITLPKDWEVWFTNANDNTNEGITHKHKPFRSVQFHPEAMPGPTDTAFIFDEFIALCKKS